MNPLISVILPLYNEPVEFAKSAIDSILNQTYQNIELILLLDNPNNSSLRNLIIQYKEKDKRVKYNFNEINLGLPNTLNIGIKLSTGEYIARMDGDDISDSRRLEKQIKFLTEHKNIDLLGSDAYAINEDGEIIGKFIKLKKDFSQKFMLKHASINLIHPTWIGKSEVFKNCMYRNYEHCEDYDFMIRAYALGYNFYNLKEMLFYVRIQQKSLRSVSRKNAYEQYINTKRLQKQFKSYLKNRDIKSLDMPEFNYDMKDKEKYQSTIGLLNDLREAFFSKKIVDIVILFIKIAKLDIRPLSFRLRVLFISKFLFALEKFKIV